MIYTGLGRVGEIADVKSHGGADVAEVYGGIGESNPIFYSRKTITGTSPLTFKGLGQPLTDYLISGDTLQNGTPSPDMPVDVVGCGVRTGNLCSGFNQGSCEFLDGSLQETDSWIRSDFIPCTGNIDYTYSFSYKGDKRSRIHGVVWFDENKSYISGTSIPYVGFESIVHTVRSPSNARFIVFETAASVSGSASYISPNDIYNIMLNLGSTALPYEPYGYKLPLTVNGTEYPIYLGNVQTTRKIKKLVLTGAEDWIYRAPEPSSTFFLEFAGSIFINNHGLCTHYLNQDSGGFSELADKHVLIRLSRDGTKSYIGLRDSSITSIQVEGVTELKEYLAAQYAAGTPVTIWYVLAEPETGIVNEPLHKIGDYADTVSMAQAEVTIPTVVGSNVLDIASAIKPSAVSITANIKPTGYGQLLDVNDVDIQDSAGEPIFIQG